jgi:hypothetical protein
MPPLAVLRFNAESDATIYPCVRGFGPTQAVSFYQQIRRNGGFREQKFPKVALPTG